jgi:DNA repair ATPase RecN
MTRNNQSFRLQINPYRSYIPISYEEMEVGFCTPEFADRIVETFNEYERLHEENETLNKALQMACLDLIKQMGGNAIHLNRRMKQYLENAKRPEHGTRAIAYLLRERQQQLDISTREFVRFCSSYKLSPQELKDIFNGKDISDRQLKPLSRILGKSVEELMEIRDGFTDNELSRLARILGTSNEELAKLFKS